MARFDVRNATRKERVHGRTMMHDMLPFRHGELPSYRFEKTDGTFTFTWAATWNAGTHAEYLDDDTVLPQEWFSRGWDYFLDAFIAQFPPENFSYTREELAAMRELKAFLGFA